MKPSLFARLLVCLTALVLSGCSSYEKVSPTAYQYTKALYSVCNRQDEPRLESVAQQIATAKTNSQLTADEADWLNSIVATAQAGDWTEAARDARRLMEAQIEGL